MRYVTGTASPQSIIFGVAADVVVVDGWRLGSEAGTGKNEDAGWAWEKRHN